LELSGRPDDNSGVTKILKVNEKNNGKLKTTGKPARRGGWHLPGRKQIPQKFC
jgi:hypothetical protein